MSAHHLTTFFSVAALLSIQDNNETIFCLIVYFSNNIFSEQVSSLKNITNLIITECAVIWVFFIDRSHRDLFTYGVDKDNMASTQASHPKYDRDGFMNGSLTDCGLHNPIKSRCL